MAKYISDRQRNLKIGITSYTENLTGLTPGVEYVIIVASAAGANGATTTFDLCISDNGSGCIDMPTT